MTSSIRIEVSWTSRQGDPAAASLMGRNCRRVLPDLQENTTALEEQSFKDISIRPGGEDLQGNHRGESIPPCI